MFSVGQKVWQRDGTRSGKVLKIEGDRVYIEQDNGAELDFRASDLTATQPAGGTSPLYRKTGGRRSHGLPTPCRAAP